MRLEELQLDEKQDIPQERSLIRYPNAPHDCRHQVVNRVVTPANRSSYPRISPLEADLMELMGDALGG